MGLLLSCTVLYVACVCEAFRTFPHHFSPEEIVFSKAFSQQVKLNKICCNLWYTGDVSYRYFLCLSPRSLGKISRGQRKGQPKNTVHCDSAASHWPSSAPQTTSKPLSHRLFASYNIWFDDRQNASIHDKISNYLHFYMVSNVYK